MIDLSVEIAGLKLKNPLIVASGPPGAKVSRIVEAAKRGAGAIITKMVLLHVPAKSFSRYYLTDKNPNYGMLYTPMDRRLNLKEGIALIRAAKQEADVPIIANIMGPGKNTSGWVELGQALEDAGVDGLELNLSCPNISYAAKLQKTHSGIEELGAVAGSDPDITYEIVKAMVDGVRVPIIPKLTPEAPDVPAIAEACKRAGAKAISAINGYSSLPGVDIENEGRPLHPGMGTQAFGGYVGAPLRFLAYKHIAHLALLFPDLAILGGGGLVNWEHTVEMIMLGATAPTYCTILMLRGFEVLTKIKGDLVKYMERKRYNRIEDFRGKGLAHIQPSEEAVINDVQAKLVAEKCNGCGLCLKLCQANCEAISELEEKKIVIDSKECSGCATCYRICPRDAIEMVTVRRPGRNLS